MIQSDKIWRKAMMPVNSKIEAVVRSLEENLIKIVLVINNSDVLVGTICDGDIRRGLLRGLDMNSPIDSIIQYEAFLASPDMKRQEIMQLMKVKE